MNYAKVRQLLIQAGWQPMRHCDVLCDENCYTKSEEKPNNKLVAFRSRGWQETHICFPTGPARCNQRFFNTKRSGLIVETGLGSQGIIPDVRQFFYGDETRRQ